MEPSKGDAEGLERKKEHDAGSATRAPTADELTQRVFSAYQDIDDPRLKIIVTSLIKHLHACVKEMRPTESEWEFAWDFMRRMAENTDFERNEFLLFADVTGVSQLIEEVNAEATALPVGPALVGPFFRANAPLREPGASIASEDTPGVRVRVSGRVYDVETNKPITAIVDVWQAAANGLYENQDEAQPDYNLRGKFKTDRDGRFQFVALMPTAYPVPTDGPVGELLRAAKRPINRPAHIHLIAAAPNYGTLVTQVFVAGDETIEQDVVFTGSPINTGVFKPLGDMYELQYDLPLRRGYSRMPKAPIP